MMTGRKPGTPGRTPVPMSEIEVRFYQGVLSRKRSDSYCKGIVNTIRSFHEAGIDDSVLLSDADIDKLVCQRHGVKNISDLSQNCRAKYRRAIRLYREILLPETQQAVV